jgi:hypothetical protein
MSPRFSSQQPLDPDIPLVSASRLLSIPSTRPGRRFRQTCIDPFPSVSYGDPITQKATGSIRLFFQNVKGLTHTTTAEDYNYYFQCIQGLDVDLFGLSETNTCWSHHHLSSDFRTSLRRYFRQSKTVFGFVSPNIDKCSQKETFQSGGNLTCLIGSAVARVGGSDILDATGLGRWSGITLEGSDGKKISIITAYRVCSGSPQTAPIGSSFLREYEFFRENKYNSLNPRRLFLVDLQKVILALQESGHSTILMLDANSTLDDAHFQVFLATCGFHDLHSGDPAPSTYIGACNRRIDFIFGCDEAARYVTRGGSLAYADGPQSDHRSLYVDLSPEFITTPSWQSILSAKSRDLHTGNPDMVQKYHTTMLDYYAQHRMVERMQQLYDVKDLADREELRSALIKWDNDQGRAMELSERILRRTPKKCAWFPALRNSAIIRRYWLLRLREHLRNEDYTSTFTRWQQSTQIHDPSFCLPFLGQLMPIQQIRQHLNRANRNFRTLQKRSTPLRLRTNQELLEKYQDDQDPNTKAESRRKAKILRNTIDGENTSQVFGNIRRVVKPVETSSLSKIMVPKNTDLDSEFYSSYRLTQETPIEEVLWETVVDRHEIDRHLLQYNRDSFRAAAASPCGHGVIHDALTFSSLSPASEALLAGTIPEDWCGQDNHLREFLASFVIPHKVQTHDDIPTAISEEDILYGFKGWKESTSTSPSGRHLGHYKALIQHSILLKCFAQFMNIVATRGIAIPRWCKATNVMIEKDAGKPCIHRLRIIHLFEADYNFFLKLQWGNRLVRQAVSLDLLHDSQHGSTPRRTAMDPIMLTQLTSDLCRILKHDLARFDNDASACYDRIIVALGMLAARRCGMPRNAIRLHADALQFMQYTVKTMYGISADNYHGTPFAPLFGTGQGSGASPAVWLSLVVLLLHTFDRLIPHRMNFVPISGARAHSRSSDAFVDDTSVGFTSTNDDTQYSDLILKLQEVAQTWEKLLFLSGGKLNLSKCSWYVLRWEWKNGRPIMRKIQPGDPTVTLTQGATSTPIAIKQSPLDHSSRMLGVYLNPLGDFSDHLLVLKKKADDFSRRILSPRMTETDIEIFHRSIYIPSMRYSLAAVAVNEESLATVQTKIIKSMLQKLHISSTIPTSLRHGPSELGGLGLYDLRTEAGIEAIKFLRNSLYSDSEAGNLIRLNLQYSQRESGVGFHLLEKPQVNIPYLTPSWILSIRQYLSNHNMSIKVSDIHLDNLQGLTDSYIMQAEHLERYDNSQKSDLNLVRMWLQVSTLAEMADPARPNCILLSYLDAARPASFEPSVTWPRQSPPTKAQKRLWKRFIVSSYLRYIPYWKSPPVGKSPVMPASAPIAPTALSDFSEYISARLSRTERRLLDGLEQVATNIKIWRAFRSKSRLHLASDGGLGDNSATHGWILSTGKEVLYKCSGPVDGPIDTNSSTRSELGGCASSLLFISSLSVFWGLRHRCSVRWYTDSKSAISRFNKFCGRGRRATRMPPDSDLLSIISECRRQLRRPFTPVWVRAHQDDSLAYDKLPLAARLNIDADFLATRYRQHGRLRAISAIDHRINQQISIYINGTPVTSQFDECIRFHVNGYHHRNYVQTHNGWDNRTWDDIDFYTFGRHFRRLNSSHRCQHFKYVHDQLPLGERRFREASIKDEALKICPCCRENDETPLHFIRCPSNPCHNSSLDILKADILTCDIHPVRYLMVDGICHFLQSEEPFSPMISQFPPHFQTLIPQALANQHTIGWANSLKGYFSKTWGAMAQLDMHKNTRDKLMGEKRMKQIISAISSHIRRLWLSRNDTLHSPDDDTLANTRSTETVEITYYHCRPHLLRTGDQHYCRRSLSKILAGTPATRRRWLRKVKQSSAELTKDGTTQTLLTNFFRPL